MTTDGRPAGTVLVAEDEALLRMVAVEALEDAGYEVVEACDGLAGLEILKSDRRIDLLITDVRMPGLNGYQLAEAGLALRPALKILVMTGYAQDSVPPSILRAVVRVLHKPLDIMELPRIAQTALSASSR